MVFRTVAGGGTPPELAGEDACATSIFKTRPEAAAAFCLIAAAAAALVLSGCSTFGPPKRGWADAKIAAQPCLEPLHGHDTRERTAGALRLVTMDLGRYKSVQERPNQESNLVLAVAISGGGERSANFAVGVLLGLENLRHKESNALREIDYFSTVSGGGMAAGGYIAELLSFVKEHGTAAGFSFNSAFTNCCGPPGKAAHGESLCGSLKKGYHDTVLRSLLSFPDKLSGIDRGDYFEKALDECVLGKTTRLRSSLTLRDMFVPKEETNQVLAPYWIPNATVLGNGAIFQFTPDVLEQYGVSHYYHDLKKRSLHCPYDLPLAVGLKASASFPVALPASTLQLSCPTTKTYLQLADGGLADNLGVLTAIQLFKAAASNATKVLLVIDAYSGNGLPFDRSEDSPSPARMALRTTEISLDSWRGRYRPLVEELCNHQGVEVVFLSFDELIDRRSLQSSPDASICYDLARQNSAGSQPLSPEAFGKAVQQIQEAARNVPTTLSIKPREQELLLLAGRLVVCLQEGLIRQKLGW